MIPIGFREETYVPRFFIDFQSRDQIAKDDVGQDFPGLEEARTAALISGREIPADKIKSDARDPLVAITITNESGQELMTIPSADLLPTR